VSIFSSSFYFVEFLDNNIMRTHFDIDTSQIINNLLPSPRYNLYVIRMKAINIKTVLRYSIAAMSIFIVASILGYATGVTNQVHAVQTLNKFKAKGEPISVQEPFVQAILIIIANSIIGFSIMLTGPIFARLFRIWFGSILILVKNGCMFGEICFLIAKSIGLEITALGMLPHSIFEFSAGFLSGGVGLYMGYNIILDQCKEPNFNTYNELLLALCNDIKESIIFYCKFILPLFIIAGFVEVFISPVILSWLIANNGAI
jgi:uncharacterized membrane protein SpoIIM required for sporulation